MPTKKTILCVDDEQDIVEALYDTLMDTDYNVKTALNGEEALKIFEAEDIALIISDQRMPGMEGSELLARINKKDPVCKKILLTGYADITSTVDAINKGAIDRYFSKPWDDDELIDAVNHLMKMHDLDSTMKKAAGGRKVLAQELELIAGFLDCQTEGICVLGKDAAIHYLNRPGLTMLKIDSLDAVKGKNFREVFELDAEHEKNPAKNGSVQIQMPAKQGSGGSIDIQASLYFADEEGKPLLRGIVFK